MKEDNTKLIAHILEIVKQRKDLTETDKRLLRDALTSLEISNKALGSIDDNKQFINKMIGSLQQYSDLLSFNNVNDLNEENLPQKINTLSHDLEKIIKSMQVHNQVNPDEFLKERIQDAFQNSESEHDFGTKLFGEDAWNDMKKDNQKIVERAFNVLKDKYPNKNITDDFSKVTKNQYFKDFLKICAIVFTFGVAALSEKTTLQSTKKTNFNKFQKLVKQKATNVNKGVLAR